MEITMRIRHVLRNLVALLSLFPLNIYAQDIHFSQFFSAPTEINPASTGDFQGAWRISNHYRNQWSSIDKPFRTLETGIEQPRFLSNPYLSAGFSAAYDESGAVGLTKTAFKASFSYWRRINSYVIRVGVQGLIVFQGIKQWGTLPSQWDQSIGAYNPALPGYENNIGEATSYPDLNLGLELSRKFSDGKQVSAGAAMFHLNQPDASFSDKKYPVPLRFLAHSRMRIPLENQYIVEPSLYYTYMATASELMAGGNLFIPVRSNGWSVTSFYGGMFLRAGFNRNLDAAVLTGGLDFLKTRVGVSYDFNVSRLRYSSNFRGAFEISIIYTEFSSLFNPGNLPCSRY